MMRYFWLLSDRNTVREISWDQASELFKRESKTYTYHIIYVHENGSIWTSKSFIEGRQFRQIQEALRNELDLSWTR